MATLAYSSCRNTSGTRSHSRSRMTPPNTPVMTAAATAMITPCPISRAIWAPRIAKTASPSASSPRKSTLKCRMIGATTTVATAASATGGQRAGHRLGGDADEEEHGEEFHGFDARLEPDVRQQLQRVVAHVRVKGVGHGDELVGAGALGELLQLCLHGVRRPHGADVEHRRHAARELGRVDGWLDLALPPATDVEEHLLDGGELPPRFRVRVGDHDVDAGHHVRLVAPRGGRLGAERLAVDAHGVIDLVGREVRG